MTQRCKHLESIKQDLREAGATDIRTERRRGAVWVFWSLSGRPFAMPIGATARDEVDATRKNLQRARRLCPELRP